MGVSALVGAGRPRPRGGNERAAAESDGEGGQCEEGVAQEETMGRD